MKRLAMMLLISGAALSVGVSAAQAKPFGAGLWSANGEQEICLKTDGTWDSPTYGGWSGYWYVATAPGEKGTLVGNFSSGYGNDSMVVSGTHLHWNEWYDDLSYVGALADGSWTWLGATCSEAHRGANATKHPMK